MLKVAKIINTHALKGELKLYFYTDDPYARFEKGNILYLKDGRELKVKSFRIQKNLGYVFFEGINDINEAEKLKNEILYINEATAKKEDDEYYYSELQGCKVYNQKNEYLGEVSELIETGANLVLRVTGGKKDFLLPFINAIVKEVNPEKKEVHIEEMEGLI